MSERDRLVAAAPVRIQGTKSTQIKVDNFGQVVQVGHTPHEQANHYIVTSRTYFPRSKLGTYVCACSCIRTFAVLCLLASFLGALSLKEGIGVSAGFLALCGLWIVLFLQHECVNKRSLPVVLQQPVFEQQRSLNEFYRVTVRELSGLTLENYNAGIGFLELSQGTMEFQAFNKRAVQSMKNARRFSRVMLFMFVCLAAYNIYFCVMK